MLKRLCIILALAIMPLAPSMVSAVSVTTDLQGVLIKGSQPAVYFYGEDGKRYVFPSEKIFYTWYSDFDSVLELTDAQLADIPIGGNVTYRPGTKLVKVTTDPRVYAVSGRGQLRWIMGEDIAIALYGEDWAKQVHDVPDSFFVDYEVNDPIGSEDEYEPEVERKTYASLKTFVSNEEPQSTVEDTGDRTIVLSHVAGKEFAWSDSDVSPLGYKLVWSKNMHPEYPTRSGDTYRYYDKSSVKFGSISSSLSGTYYVRVCEYLGGKCGAYSNEVQVSFSDVNEDGTVSDDEKNESNTSEVHTIVLSSNGNQQFSWTDTAYSDMGYKLVYSKNANPEYPTRSGDTYIYYDNGSTKNGKIASSLATGTYYVRVCEYLGGKCGAYSNQVTFEVEATETEDIEKDSTAETTNADGTHDIILSYNGDQEFSWTDSIYSKYGYKLVYSKNANPEYPTRDGDTYIFYDNGDTKSGIIKESLESDAPYYVRVCEYLGGRCGAYSNQVTFLAE